MQQHRLLSRLSSQSYHIHHHCSTLHLDITAAGMTGCSCCVCHWHQTVIPAQQSSAQPDKSEAFTVITMSQLSVKWIHQYPLTVWLKIWYDCHFTDMSSQLRRHVQAIHHIRHLLRTELAQTLACRLTLRRVDYCNTVLYGTIHYLRSNTAVGVMTKHGQSVIPRAQLGDALHNPY